MQAKHKINTQETTTHRKSMKPKTQGIEHNTVEILYAPPPFPYFQRSLHPQILEIQGVPAV